MRLFILLAVIFFVIAFICVQVPTAVLTIGGLGWMILGLLCIALDFLLGGPVYGPAVLGRRVVP